MDCHDGKDSACVLSDMGVFDNQNQWAEAKCQTSATEVADLDNAGGERVA
ncbi:hypothetical protein PWG15_34985 (plasmid) [Ensifer adhaerens]|nr:hypothetical protein [Ensifer adhaerens]WDZ81550.1 hypothetical protein PWG15_34985 [Ensifer adhaerens]